ncbi:hypothetical protein [Thiobacillus sp.]|uniref:hypothetical protein n=1 Tax=Thiobacillus sp. TaxID=924 RepID=UPI001839F095|nr:hypothetical protein [Thiobacillus sp.]MBC2729771.1 hypothetical protein [Thiobacillus sp.]MBC2738506.1 hypothetical protein [Thiobacillus sp.]MBC2761214.1 hypothetical protein [Thiobacillus sp.]
MNGCPLDEHALQQLATELEATPPRPHHSGLLDKAGRALSGQSFRFALTRGGWYRPGGVVRGNGERVTDNLEAWAEAELADCEGDMESLIERHRDDALFATRHSGRTHYFVAPYGLAPADFVQLEIEELHEVLDRKLFPDDDPPADLQELVDPLHPAKLEAHPVAPPHYRFRRLTDMRHAVVRLPAPVGQIHPMARFLAEWAASQNPGKDLFCDHWIIGLREHQDRYRNPVLSASPVSLDARALKPFHWNVQLQGPEASNQLQAFDRAAGYVGAWYFHLVAGGLSPRDLAATLVGDLDAGYQYLREQEIKLLTDWVRTPYSA